MIQRIQSAWLLAAGLLSLATFRMTFWASTLKDGSVQKICAQNSNLLIYVAAAVLVVVAIATIFLFRNRPLQTRLCLLGMVLSLALLVLEVQEKSSATDNANFSDGGWRPGIILPILVMVAFFLARRGVRKDEKLVKSLDRLR